MQRRAPLKAKNPWRPKDAPPRREAKQTTSHARPKAVAVVPETDEPPRPQPKENPLECEPYRRLVATFACYRCRLEGRSQAAHGDLNKGAGMKTDDRTVWPACADGPGYEGCHTYVGRRMGRAERREFEARAARDTRAQVIAMGRWPKGLPLWVETTEETVWA